MEYLNPTTVIMAAVLNLFLDQMISKSSQPLPRLLRNIIQMLNHLSSIRPVPCLGRSRTRSQEQRILPRDLMHFADRLWKGRMTRTIRWIPKIPRYQPLAFKYPGIPQVVLPL